jgi:hypothetical protein
MQKSAALVAAEDDLAREKANHLADLNKVFNALRDESESRGWCEEYDDFTESLVDQLFVKPTEGVRKDWEIDVVGLSVKVLALTEAEAVEKLHGFLSNSMFRGVLETE